MELNITKFFHEAGMMDYSASRAEIGDNAGVETWASACEDSKEYFLLDDDEKREDFRKYVKDFGAWSDEEIQAWDDVELNALCIQLIAGDIREADLDTDSPDWQAYEEKAEQGQCGGRIFEGNDGNVYYYIGD